MLLQNTLTLFKIHLSIYSLLIDLSFLKIENSFASKRIDFFKPNVLLFTREFLKYFYFFRILFGLLNWIFIFFIEPSVLSF